MNTFLENFLLINLFTQILIIETFIRLKCTLNIIKKKKNGLLSIDYKDYFHVLEDVFRFSILLLKINKVTLST
jgi:hypothetical protein